MAPRRVHLVSLGCPKNRVDSEFMLGSLLAEGFEAVAEPEAADVIVVNTCGFIQPACEESVEAILEMARHKERGTCQSLVVTGCMVRRYQQDLVNELPEVDLFLGPGEVPRLGELLAAAAGPRLLAEEPRWLPEGTEPRAGSWAGHSAWLKVSDGCHRRCAYCTIPDIRGQLRSRPVPSLLEEARRLVDGGVRELCLVAQDLTAYGQDLGDGTDLPALLGALETVPDLRWVRLMYLHPRGISDALLEAMGTSGKVLPYLDVPLQHVSTRMLAAMGRGITREEQEAVLDRVRRALPGVTLRTTLMVGFPGETAADFQELLAFVEAWRFHRLGVFPWWPEEGTRAFQLPDRVPEEVAQERQATLEALQADLARRQNRALRGTIVRVMVDGPSADHAWVWQGRQESQAPEVDGVTYLDSPPPDLRPGQVLRARIRDADAVDFVAELLDRE